MSSPSPNDAPAPDLIQKLFAMVQQNADLAIKNEQGDIKMLADLKQDAMKRAGDQLNPEEVVEAVLAQFEAPIAVEAAPAVTNARRVTPAEPRRPILSLRAAAEAHVEKPSVKEVYSYLRTNNCFFDKHNEEDCPQKVNHVPKFNNLMHWATEKKESIDELEARDRVRKLQEERDEQEEKNFIEVFTARQLEEMKKNGEKAQKRKRRAQD